MSTGWRKRTERRRKERRKERHDLLCIATESVSVRKDEYTPSYPHNYDNICTSMVRLEIGLANDRRLNGLSQRIKVMTEAETKEIAGDRETRRRGERQRGKERRKERGNKEREMCMVVRATGR